MEFPASAGPWFDLTFSSPNVATRFVKKFTATYAYQAVVSPANPKVVTTNGSKEEIEAILKMLDAPRRRVYVTRTLRDSSRRSSAKIKPMSERRTKAWEVWNRDPYEGDFYVESFRDKGEAERRIARLKRSHPDNRYFVKHRPVPVRMQFGRRHTRKSGREQAAVERRHQRDARKYSYFEKGTEPLREGYSVAWRPSGAGVKWFLRRPSGKIIAHGQAHDGDKAISSAKFALSNELIGRGLHGSRRSRGYAYELRNERDARKRHHHRSTSAPPFATQKKISRKIRLLREEGYPPKQAAAIAYRMYGASRSSRRRANPVRSHRKSRRR